MAQYAGIDSQALYYVPLNKTYEVWRLKVTNTSERERHLSTFSYAEFTNEIDSAASFSQAEEEANEDYALKLSGIDDLVGSGQLSNGELIEMIKTQSYELTQLRKENLLLKSKLVKAAKMGFPL